MAATVGTRLGRKALSEVATIVKPDTVLGWHRKLIVRKFTPTPSRTRPGRPQVDLQIEEPALRMAHENRTWGYDRIVGALANLGQTVENNLGRNVMTPALARRKHTT